MTVTKQQQLEWLAKHMDGWVCDRPEAYLMSVDEVGFVVGLATTISTVEMIYGRHHAITSQEWQQERDKMQKQKDSSWHERGELPPVGVECLSPGGETIMIASHGRISDVPVAFYPFEVSGLYSVACAKQFRPLRTEREKAIGALIEIICAGGELSKDGSAAREIAERIYEAQQTKRKS